MQKKFYSETKTGKKPHCALITFQSHSFDLIKVELFHFNP